MPKSENYPLFQKARQLMKKGILQEPKTGLPFFTGYAYKTLYDWDQYFEAVPQLYFQWSPEYILNAIRIFLSRQNGETGFIPRCVRLQTEIIDPADEVSQQEQGEMVKPFLAQMGVLLLNAEQDRNWLTPQLFDGLQKYVNHWLEDRDIAKIGLAVWRSAPHTGCDNQHERAGYWQDDFCAGVDLNAYLVRECRALGLLAEALDDNQVAAHWQERADTLTHNMQEKLWNAERGFFLDLDIRDQKPLPVLYSAAFSVLWAHVATPAQAERMVREHLLNADEFFTNWRLPSLAAKEKGYTEDGMPGDLGCHWRANVWAPVNYYTVHGLQNYGYKREAMDLAENTLNLIQKEGLREYYTSETGKGCGLDPFWGWTITALFLKMEIEQSFDPTLLTLANQDGWNWMRENLKEKGE